MWSDPSWQGDTSRYVPGGVPLPLWERLQPHERRVVYLSPDRLETHYAVAAETSHHYHTGRRDFVMVGFRAARCSDGNILLGWCGSERGCSEAPHRRILYPEHDYAGRTVAQVPGRGGHA